jgi:hypothetical protein
MIATTIMISTRVKPPRRLLNLFNMLFAFFLSLVCLTAIHDTDRGCGALKALLVPRGGGSFQFVGPGGDALEAGPN